MDGIVAQGAVFERSQNRFMSAPNGYRELLESAALVKMPPQACLFLSGEDALEWLNGQVTQELRTMADGESRAACLCSVTGQIEAMLLIARLPGRIAVQTFAEAASKLIERAESSVFMEDVRVESAPESWELYAIRGPNSTQVVAQVNPMAASEGVVFSFGQKAFIWSSRESSVSMRLPLASAEAFEAARIEMGEPIWGKDIDAKTLPAELGARFLEEHVSYTKGCYTGQEVLMRMHARGHANRSWVGLVLDNPLEPGAILSTSVRENAGKVSSSAISPKFGPVAAAMMHRDSADPGNSVTSGQTTGEVREMPFRV